jgi:hypothetical protein
MPSADSDPTENEDIAADAEGEAEAEGESPAGTEPAPATADNTPLARRRDPKFRVDLIRRLPVMAPEKWSAKDSFKLDEEWGGVIAIQSNAILGPLEPLVKGRRGEPKAPHQGDRS